MSNKMKKKKRKNRAWWWTRFSRVLMFINNSDCRHFFSSFFVRDKRLARVSFLRSNAFFFYWTGLWKKWVVRRAWIMKSLSNSKKWRWTWFSHDRIATVDLDRRQVLLNCLDASLIINDDWWWRVSSYSKCVCVCARAHELWLFSFFTRTWMHSGADIKLPVFGAHHHHHNHRRLFFSFFSSFSRDFR